MGTKQKTIIEEYMDCVYKTVMILLAASCLAAAGIYAALKAAGLADFVAWSKWGGVLGSLPFVRRSLRICNQMSM